MIMEDRGSVVLVVAWEKPGIAATVSGAELVMNDGDGGEIREGITELAEETCDSGELFAMIRKMEEISLNRWCQC
jgi:hypothetical protein